MDGRSPVLAQKQLSGSAQSRINTPLNLNFMENSYQIDLAAAEPKVNIDQQITQAFLIGHSSSFWQNFLQQAEALTGGDNLPLTLTFANPDALSAQISRLKQSVDKNPVNSQIALDNQFSISPPQDGIEIDEPLLREQLVAYLTLQSGAPVSLPIKTITPAFGTKDAQQARQALERIKSSPIRLHFGADMWTIDQPTLYTLLNLNPGQAAPEADGIASLLDNSKLTLFIEELASKVDQPSQNARFVINTSSRSAALRVEQFQPAQQGQALDRTKTAELIIQALSHPTISDMDLPVTTTKPQITNEQVNNLGINQLLAEGMSNFAGSIENRIFNIGLAASKLHGILIAPGATFSFNNTVGEISAVTGYKQAYVIKSGRTVLDDGGGVCQVSTTLFRAILKAGLPITERTGHAYRVGYYEQGGFPPGLDATVFAPSVDLKFKNDTPAYLLLQSYIVGKNLYIDIYGTSDGRLSKISTPKVTDQTPPPPDLRQDDPTLPRGTVKQVDWAAWGANVSFTRTVTKGDQTLISETWRTSYRPWQAVYMVGTKD